MIADVPSFLRYFEGIHARTVRDVSALPAEAERWRPPPSLDAEASWGAPEIVRHIAEGRGFFVDAFLGKGWVWRAWPQALETRDGWVPALERSRAAMEVSLRDAPEERLHARVALLDDPERSMSAWRTLLLLVEHEVAHRAQLTTYAGLNGWPVHQIFGRTNEWVVAKREEQLGRAADAPRDRRPLMREDEVPEADRQEQEERAPDAPAIPDDASEADALEQAEPAAPPPPPTVPDEVPEADALEQGLDAAGDDDEDRRGSEGPGAER